MSRDGEEESEYVENPPEDEIDHKEETPLLSFSEETVTTPASDFLEKHESPPTTLDDKPDTAEEKNMWTSIGDAVFSVVTGGETRANDFSSDEDEDDDDAEEGAASKIPERFEEAEKTTRKGGKTHNYSNQRDSECTRSHLQALSVVQQG